MANADTIRSFASKPWPNYHLAIVEDQDCWALAIVDDKRSHTQGGLAIYWPTRADIEQRAIELLGAKIASALPVRMRFKRILPSRCVRGGPVDSLGPPDKGNAS
jgi:hypothetical protein